MNPANTASTATVRLVESEVMRASGRRYQIDFGKLDERSCREVLRLLRDLEHDSLMRAQRAQRMPWRRP